MAGAPAYRYDSVVQQPARHRAQPPVRVVPGRKHERFQTLSDFQVFLVKAAVFLLAVALCVGFVQVALGSAAYTVASSSSELRAEIANVRTEGQSLAVQKSLVAAPSNLRTIASDQLKMAAPGAVGKLVMEPDVVVLNASGQLSLVGSIAQAAALE